MNMATIPVMGARISLRLCDQIRHTPIILDVNE